MRSEIPAALGFVSLSFAALGCSPAVAIAEAGEKVCKANCECPESEDFWNSEKNCKKACAGDAKTTAALLADREEEPCDDIKDIAKDLKKCAKESCGEDRYECLGEVYQDLYECWPPDDNGYYELGGEDDESLAIDRPLTSQDMMQRLLFQANFSEDALAN